MKQSEALAAYYRYLSLPAEATAEDVERAYFRRRAEMLRANKRREILQLKEARDAIKAHLKAAPAAQPDRPVAKPKEADRSPSPLAELTAELANKGLTARVSIRENTLHLGIAADAATPPADISSQVRQLLNEVSPEDCGLGEVETVRVYGLSAENKPLWRQSFALPKVQLTADDVDPYSFNNRFTNTLVFPAILLFAGLLNSIEFIKLLLFGIHIWIHEVGHATAAWLCGYRAIPLPFGWTNIGAEKSFFVYFGVLALFGLLAWAGFKEQRRWPMVLAGVLAIAQFVGTWILSDNTVDMLFSFGGIGGEFYLSTLLMVSFFFPLPEYWRWDFYRYPAALCAGFTFTGSFWQWRHIDRGLADIPWGTLFGGAGDAGGDMNQLNLVHGWSVARIVDTYNGLGSLCAIAIISTYLYVLFKQRNHQFLYGLWLRWGSQGLLARKP